MKSLEHKTNLIFDLFFSVIFMPLLIIMGPAHYWWTISPLFASLVVLFFYGCYFATKYLKLPQLVISKSYCKLAVIAGVFIALTYLLTLYPLPKVDFVIPSMSEYQTRVRNYNIAIGVWFMFSVVCCYSLTVAFIKELYSRMIQQSIIENQRNKAELALFKAQINPHFLFNTLNSLYSLVIGTSQKAEDAFIKFSELLKYTYVTADNDWVTIDEEITYINRKHSVDDDTAKIPPMIFLTFIENAFKYGASTSKDSEIFISLTLSDGILAFETRNSIVKHADEFRKDMPIGINNCRSRLAALFPERHSLTIKEENGIFMIKLKIELNNHE